jgi:DNA-directed RNA polymerase subunit M/transcription elongation factor TFIIS
MEDLAQPFAREHYRQLLTAKVSAEFAKKCDAYALKHRCKLITQQGCQKDETIKIYEYGDKQLLETEDPATHEFYATMQYKLLMELFLEHGETDFFFTKEESTEMVEDKVETTESNFKCKNCKSKKIIIDQKQSRSADEGMDVILVCMDCGHRQRIRG